MLSVPLSKDGNLLPLAFWPFNSAHVIRLASIHANVAPTACGPRLFWLVLVLLQLAMMGSKTERRLLLTVAALAHLARSAKQSYAALKALVLRLTLLRAHAKKDGQALAAPHLPRILARASTVDNMELALVVLVYALVAIVAQLVRMHPRRRAPMEFRIKARLTLIVGVPIAHLAPLTNGLPPHGPHAVCLAEEGHARVISLARIITQLLLTTIYATLLTL